MIHKKISVLLSTMALTTIVYAQQPPQGTSGGGAFWRQGGNIGGPGAPNIFGTATTNNNPIYTQTNGINRTKLNGNVTYPVNGYNLARNGFMLIGNDGPLLTGAGNIYTAKGAYSLLHLNGEGTDVQELGYRPWMRTGLTLTGNSDLSYFGLRPIGGTEDRTETVITWSDNQSGIADELVFRFTGQIQNGSITESTDFASADDLDGLHIGRFTPGGLFGLGNTFGHIDQTAIAPFFNTPRSLLHLSYQYRPPTASDTKLFEQYGFMQITYRRANGGVLYRGMGESANDGLRFGIDNNLFITGGQPYLNSYLRWQEQSSFIIQTESENNDNIEDDERIRITSIGALVTNFGTNYIGNIGVDNRTRIGISSNGELPVTRPMSLLHLGFDINNTSTGWRNWMDIGAYTTNGTDNMYIGLKRESDDPQNDRFDAIINWGDNINANPNVTNGPDNLRFIFTANSVTGSGPASTNNGLEGARMTPTTVGVFTGIGGTPSVNPYGPTGLSDNPTATLEVNGWGTASNVNGGNSGLRFTNLNTTSIPIVNPGAGFLSVDAEGDVIYTHGSGGAGAACGSASNVGALTSNHRINLNNNNYYFYNMQPAASVNPTFNKVGIGYICDVTLPAKLSVFQQEATPINFMTIGAYVQNRDAGTTISLDYVGIKSVCNGVQTIPRNTNTGGEFSAFNANRNIGVRGTAYPGAWTSTAQAPHNYGGYFTSSPLTSTGDSYGIYATGGTPTSPTADNVRAGFFNGIVEATNFVVTTSDAQFKDSVNEIKGGLKIITQLKPVQFRYDIANYPQMNFSAEQQYGFIAQQVQNVLPDLIHTSHLPAELDSLGDTISAEVYYKSMNYNAIIPINTQAIIELNQKVDKATLSDQTIKTNVQDLNGSLNKVLQMRGVSYDWNQSVNPSLNLDSANHIGFIAQEIAQVDPRLTFLADDSLLHVEYDKVVPILAEAIEELNNTVEQKDSIINDLNNRLTNLENCLSALLPTLCQMNQSAIQANTPAAQEAVRQNLQVTLSNRSTIILDQNVPNPFAEQTVINFSIPASVAKAQMHFYDGNGRLIQTLEIAERGLGAVTVFGSDLSSGTYTYTLVADGAVVATKKMMKQ